MQSDNDDKALALERLSDWKEKGATLLLRLSDARRNFSIAVSVLGISSESVSFNWLLHFVDTQGTFLTTDGHFVVWLRHAEFSVSNHSEPSVNILQGEFRCVLTVIRPTAF
jgi:hypothetical protein